MPLTSTALLVSMMQIELKSIGKLIALALTTKKQFVRVACRGDRNEINETVLGAAPTTNELIQEYGILQYRIERRLSAHKGTTTKTVQAMLCGGALSLSVICIMSRYARGQRLL